MSVANTTTCRVQLQRPDALSRQARAEKQIPHVQTTTNHFTIAVNRAIQFFLRIEAAVREVKPLGVRWSKR